MKRRYLLSLIILCAFVTLATAEGGAETDAPKWVKKKQDVWVEKGIIYAKGSAKATSVALSMSTAEARARTNLCAALVNKKITKYPSIPANTEESTTFTVNGVTGALGEVKVINNYTAKDNTVYTLISCNGAEVKR